MATDFNSVELAERLDEVSNNQLEFTEQIRDWLGGVVGGGPNGDGKYPLSNGLGVTYMVACPAQIVAQTQKGDPGVNGAADLVCGWQFGLADDERIGGYIATYNTTYSAGNSRAYAAGAPTGGSAVVRILKNGQAWGTVTWASGSNVGTVAFSSAPTVVPGDRIEFRGPLVRNNTFADGDITIAGA